MAAIRAATPADAEAMATTVSEAFVAYRDFAPPDWRPPDRLELAMGIAVRLRTEGMRAWVAEDADGPAGHVTYLPATQARKPAEDPDLAHLEQIFVRRAHWGTGLATRLLRLAVAEAAGEGFTAMRLMTPVGQARARRFYEREGWAVRGEPMAGEPIGLDLIEYRVALTGSGSRATP